MGPPNFISCRLWWRPRGRLGGPLHSSCSFTRWTHRGLSAKELCAAFDVPVSWYHLFQDVSPGRRHMLPFLRAAPTKLLKRAWDCFDFRPGGAAEVVGTGTPQVGLAMYSAKSDEDEVDDVLVRRVRWADPVAQIAESADAKATPGLDFANIMTSASNLDPVANIMTSASNLDPVPTSASNSGPATESKQEADFSASNSGPATESQQEADFSKATKADDAAVPVAIWDCKVWRLGLHTEEKVEAFTRKWTARRARTAERLQRRQQLRAPIKLPKNRWVEDRAAIRAPLTVLREAVCSVWKRRVFTSFVIYLKEEYGSAWAVSEAARQDVAAGRECISRMADADFWSWRRGSRCFFWRWPRVIRHAIRDGFPLWVISALPRNTKPQRGEKDPGTKAKMCEKVDKVRLLEYIMKGYVISLTNFFSVPKGETDIRMVYDATKSRLNHALWVPSFALPTAESLTRQVEESTWMADLDLGDMFLNFMLDAAIRPYCGVDLRPFFENEVRPGETLWERWERCLMGLKSSPYVCVKAMAWGMEVVYGDKNDPANAYRWDRVVLNLPGSATYDPRLVWIKRIRSDTGKIAGATVTYVDDLRSVGESEEECWRVAHQAGSRIGYLGIQNAPRKTRPPSQTPGAWAGTVVVAKPEGVGVKCSEEKWSKGKRLLTALHTQLESQEELIHKPLEQMRGFFIHLQGTYPSMTPYLKGMHLTLDGWRRGRDEELWKVMAKPGPEGYWDDREDIWIPADTGKLSPPKTVKPAPRLRDDVKCLLRLMDGETPPVRMIRTRSISIAVYGFVDASGVGFGSSFQTQSGLAYRYGLWGRDADNTSSNYKELRNLVEAVEEGVKSGDLLGSEVFVFTDNSTAEGAYYKGNTDSRLLFDLVLRLRVLDMSAAIILHIVHIAGTRMIAQGVDGLSRGDQTEGVMAGRHILEFIPLHLSALERSREIQEWVQLWTQQKEVIWLRPEDWYEKGHGRQGGRRNREGIWIPEESKDDWLFWCPPPAIADAALEELAASRHKRTHINHVFVCPRLMTQKWRKRLHKLADVVFEVPAGRRTFWPGSMHEPLIVGLTLRFVSCRPWQLRFSKEVLELGGQLRGLWKESEGAELTVLRELCNSPSMLESL